MMAEVMNTETCFLCENAKICPLTNIPNWKPRVNAVIITANRTVFVFSAEFLAACEYTEAQVITRPPVIPFGIAHKAVRTVGSDGVTVVRIVRRSYKIIKDKIKNADLKLNSCLGISDRVSSAQTEAIKFWNNREVEPQGALP